MTDILILKVKILLISDKTPEPMQEACLDKHRQSDGHCLGGEMFILLFKWLNKNYIIM